MFGLNLKRPLGGVLASLVLASAASAQHLHEHGDHFDIHENVEHGHDGAGHMVDDFGHHIDGDGHHTGSTGFFDNGFSSNSQGPHYPHYPHYPSNNLFVTPSYPSPQYYPNTIVTAPPISSSNVISSPPSGALGSPIHSANKLPFPGTANALPGSNRGGQVVIANPRDSGGSIRYSLNNFEYSINPGESQRLNLDRDWIISFDNGMNRQVKYRLADGRYEFTADQQTGWNLVKREAERPSAPVIEAPPVAASSNPLPTDL